MGSAYGRPGTLVLVIALGWRAVQEEQALKTELPGQDRYLTKVKYRRIPYVW